MQGGSIFGLSSLCAIASPGEEEEDARGRHALFGPTHFKPKFRLMIADSATLLHRLLGWIFPSHKRNRTESITSFSYK
jgi:hypothetical protein